MTGFTHARPVHAGLVAALRHCRLGTPRAGLRPTDRDFHRAKSLGLLAQDSVWRTTEQGDGVLVAAGLLEGTPAPERLTLHVLWARHHDDVAPSAYPQFVAAFSDGLVDCWPTSYEAQRAQAEEWYRDFFDLGEVVEFFTTVERLDRPPFPGEAAA